MNKKLGDKERAIAIDEVPLEWCFQPGVKLDFRHFDDGHVVSADDVEAELKRTGHELQPLEIVVVNTRAGSRYGFGDYVSAGCGMGYEATMYLLERGVRLTGTDAWSLDAPFVHTAKKYGESRDASLIWECIDGRQSTLTSSTCSIACRLRPRGREDAHAHQCEVPVRHIGRRGRDGKRLATRA